MKIWNYVLIAVICLIVFFIAGNVWAGDSTFNWFQKPGAEKPPVPYGAGTPCFMTTSYYGVTAMVEEGEMVHIIVLSRNGKVAGSSRNRVTRSVQPIARTSALLERACGDTLLLLPLEEQEVIKPFLLAKK